MKTLDKFRNLFGINNESSFKAFIGKLFLHKWRILTGFVLLLLIILATYIFQLPWWIWAQPLTTASIAVLGIYSSAKDKKQPLTKYQWILSILAILIMLISLITNFQQKESKQKEAEFKKELINGNKQLSQQAALYKKQLDEMVIQLATQGDSLKQQRFINVLNLFKTTLPLTDMSFYLTGNKTGLDATNLGAYFFTDYFKTLAPLKAKIMIQLGVYNILQLDLSRTKNGEKTTKEIFCNQSPCSTDSFTINNMPFLGTLLNLAGSAHQFTLPHQEDPIYALFHMKLLQKAPATNILYSNKQTKLVNNEFLIEPALVYSKGYSKILSRGYTPALAYRDLTAGSKVGEIQLDIDNLDQFAIKKICQHWQKYFSKGWIEIPVDNVSALAMYVKIKASTPYATEYEQNNIRHKILTMSWYTVDDPMIELMEVKSTTGYGFSLNYSSGSDMSVDYFTDHRYSLRASGNKGN